MQNYLTDILPNRSLGLCLLQHYQENSPGHIARVSQQSQPGFGSVMNAVCLKTKRGNFTSACLVTESPVQPVLSQEGAPWDLLGAWFSAPNHCLTRLQCSHSRATHFHLCWLSQVLHIPKHRVSGAPGKLQEGEPQPAPAKSCTPEPWPAMHPGPRVQSTQLQPVLFSLLISLQQTHVWYSPSSESCEICTLKKLL